ncbi:MAG: S8 family serine peptidase [Verrucomicrobiota bacterium JB023]|nr:S8 family serine peptidase [Verrucomicrobiota bacterium JB023]
MKPLESFLAIAFIALAAVVGWLLFYDATATEDRQVAAEANGATPLTRDPVASSRSGQSAKKSSNVTMEDVLLGIPGERLVRFGSEEDYQAFLESLNGSGLRLLGQLDALRVARIGYDSISDLDDFLGDLENEANYLVTVPGIPDSGSVQAGAIGFGDSVLEWLGVTGDNSAWGEGVKIAIIDSGISAHDALPGNILHLDLTQGGPNDFLNGHGTAVASLIAGESAIITGLSPSASLIDVRVANGDGESSSFLLAQGILAAVDAGADLINISMGSYGDSIVVRDAVAYAESAGVAVVASSGNEGYDQPAWPANIAEVTAVGSVDANGDLVDFSNTGENLDLVAPGLQIYAAWLDGKYVEFTGTSASAPLVVASAATVMSEFDLSAQAAVDYVINYASEGGYPGLDEDYGNGVLNVGTTINSQTKGIYDLAAVSNYIDDNGDLLVTVQNQGTETFSNSSLTVFANGLSSSFNVPNLAPTETETFTIPANIDPEDGFLIESEVTINGAYEDANPYNDAKVSEQDPLFDE